MANALAFWIIMGFLALFGGWSHFGGAANPRIQMGFSLALFVLFALLGWAVFGPALKG